MGACRGCHRCWVCTAPRGAGLGRGEQCGHRWAGKEGTEGLMGLLTAGGKLCPNPCCAYPTTSNALLCLGVFPLLISLSQHPSASPCLSSQPLPSPACRQVGPGCGAGVPATQG